MATRVIALKDVERLRAMVPKRCRFLDHEIVKERSDGTYVVGTKFGSVDRLFEAETGITTRAGSYGPFIYLSTQDQIEAAIKWQNDRRSLIFLRDTLDCSIALDFNLAEAAIYTDMGRAEHEAKTSGNQKAIQFLVDRCRSAVSELGLYRTCSSICAVPPSPEKRRDLPTEIVKRVAAASNKEDVSKLVCFRKVKQGVKGLALKDRWGALESAQLEVSQGVRGKSIILLDDKYQSGTTVQFVASKLLQAGASEVLGLFCVKTWRDTDNT